MSETLDFARQYVAAGLSVIPIEPGGKSPHNPLLDPGALLPWASSDERAPWRVYTTRMPRDEELIAWFTDTDAGIGIVGGAISGGLVRIDFESSACLLTWQAELRREDPALATATTKLPIVETGKGHHVYFRCDDPPGHDILSSCGEGNSLIVLAETQGENCYCVAPPSVVPDSYTWSDKAGAFVYERRYEWATEAWASFRAIPTLDQDLAAKLLDAARFRDFWQPTLTAHWGVQYGTLHRSGLTIGDRREPSHRDRHLGWEHLKALRAYLDRYEALLQAVETAPPPSSYDVGDDWEEYQEDDE